MGMSSRARIVVVGAVGAISLFVAAAAWACTNHTGTIWFCPSSASCSTNANVPAAGAAAWMDGAALIDSENITIKYAATANPANDDCHLGSASTFGTGTTDSLGRIIGTVSGTAPSAGNWTFCAINPTGDEYSGHYAVVLTTN